MAQGKNAYATQQGNYTNGRLRFGTLDPKTNTINSVQIESGNPNIHQHTTSHFMRLVNLVVVLLIDVQVFSRLNVEINQ